ncbi:MAG: hypothetical protein PCFJNLEI_01490 [Verrucomicrobiae bacterium]|nr:hypothetical protein [Verrucomicrobiae bacterium]
MKLLHAVCVGVVVGSAAWAAPLDGTKWKVTLTPDAESVEIGAKGWEDELVFAADQMTATTSAKRGFKTSVYLVTEDDEVLKWQTIQHSEAAGVANWSCQVSNAEMTGRLVLSQRDGTRWVFAVTGGRTSAKPGEGSKKE